MAEDEKTAIELGDQYLNHYIQVWAGATEAWSRHSSTDYPGYSGLGAILKANTGEKMRKNLQALVGTPKQIIEQLHYIKGTFELDQIIWQVDFGAQPEKVSHQTVKLFIDQVMPMFQTIEEEAHVI